MRARGIHHQYIMDEKPYYCIPHNRFHHQIECRRFILDSIFLFWWSYFYKLDHLDHSCRTSTYRYRL